MYVQVCVKFICHLSHCQSRNIINPVYIQSLSLCGQLVESLCRWICISTVPLKSRYNLHLQRQKSILSSSVWGALTNLHKRLIHEVSDHKSCLQGWIQAVLVFKKEERRNRERKDILISRFTGKITLKKINVCQTEGQIQMGNKNVFIRFKDSLISHVILERKC